MSNAIVCSLTVGKWHAAAEFIALVGGAVAWSFAADANRPERPHRIGILALFPASDPSRAGFLTAATGLSGRKRTTCGINPFGKAWGTFNFNTVDYTVSDPLHFSRTGRYHLVNYALRYLHAFEVTRNILQCLPVSRRRSHRTTPRCSIAARHETEHRGAPAAGAAGRAAQRRGLFRPHPRSHDRRRVGGSPRAPVETPLSAQLGDRAAPRHGRTPTADRSSRISGTTPSAASSLEPRAIRPLGRLRRSTGARGALR